MEIETNCQALSDFLKNDKLQAHQAHWTEVAMGQRVIVVLQHLGATNKVTNGLSRKWLEHVGRCDGGEDWTVDPGWESSRGIVNVCSC